MKRNGMKRKAELNGFCERKKSFGRTLTKKRNGDDDDGYGGGVE